MMTRLALPQKDQVTTGARATLTLRLVAVRCCWCGRRQSINVPSGTPYTGLCIRCDGRIEGRA